jgi:Mg/Co/Ni transporter MgtE
LRLFRLPVRERDSFLSVREIGIGALLGLIIGVITVILLSMR